MWSKLNKRILYLVYVVVVVAVAIAFVVAADLDVVAVGCKSRLTLVLGLLCLFFLSRNHFSSKPLHYPHRLTVLVCIYWPVLNLYTVEGYNCLLELF